MGYEVSAYRIHTENVFFPEFYGDEPISIPTVAEIIEELGFGSLVEDLDSYSKKEDSFLYKGEGPTLKYLITNPRGFAEEVEHNPHAWDNGAPGWAYFLRRLKEAPDMFWWIVCRH